MLCLFLEHLALLGDLLHDRLYFFIQLYKFLLVLLYSLVLEVYVCSWKVQIWITVSVVYAHILISTTSVRVLLDTLVTKLKVHTISHAPRSCTFCFLKVNDCRPEAFDAFTEFLNLLLHISNDASKYLLVYLLYFLINNLYFLIAIFFEVVELIKNLAGHL